MTIKPSDHIGSLSKGLRVLEAFGADTPTLTITEAAQVTGLDRATARRCLLTLHHDGYANYDGKHFSLTHRALRLGQSAMAALSLRQIVQPVIDELSETIGQSCAVTVLDGTEIVYVARAQLVRVISVGLSPGARLPAHCTAAGRVLLAQLPEAKVREDLEATDLTPRTVYSLGNARGILAQIATIRAAGYALVDQEVELGLRSLAVPLYDTQGSVVAALSTALTTIHETAGEVMTEYLPHLKGVQAELARSL